MFFTILFAGAVLAATVSTAAPTAGRGKRINGTSYAGGLHYGTDIVEVSADIVIPTCSVGLPRNSYSTYTSDGWVGLSAYGYKGLIQTGVTCNVAAGSDATYTVWTEWAPDPPVFYNATDFRPGDVVHARVVAHSHNSGTTHLLNRRTGQKLETSYTDQKHQLTLGDAEWVTESQLQLTILGPEGSLGAKYTPWQFKHAQYRTKDGKKQTFDLSGPNDHILDTVLGGYKIAEGIFDGRGHLQVNFTTPSNYTVPGL